jgi:hypothetical protein
MQSSQSWILGRRNLDILTLVLPGYLGLLLVWLFSDIPSVVLIIGFVALVLVDSGHVYTSFLRGAFFETNNLVKTSLSVIAVFLVLYFWLKFQIPYFWSFIVYFTLFHHIRQFAGLIKWYNKIESYFDPLLIQFFYISVFLSIVLFHVNPAPTDFFYVQENDILFFPSEVAFNTFLAMQLIVWVIYLAYAFYIHKTKSQFPVKSHFFFCATVLFYFLVCISNRQSELVLVPLLLAHGIPYHALIVRSQKSLNPKVDILKFSAVLVGFVLFLALVEFGLQETAVDFNPMTHTTDVQRLVLALFLTPLIFHYCIDAYIWKSKHFLARKIYSS